MRDLISGKRKRILDKDVKYKQLAHYDGLTIKEMRSFIITFSEVADNLLATWFFLSDLKLGVIYSFKVQAVNRAGSS